jgi:hypothetical protein
MVIRSIIPMNKHMMRELSRSKVEQWRRKAAGSVKAHAGDEDAQGSPVAHQRRWHWPHVRGVLHLPVHIHRPSVHIHRH